MPLEPLKLANEYLKTHDVPRLIYQGKLNILDREPQIESITDYCVDNGIGFISFLPLAQGLLISRYLNGIPADSRMAKQTLLGQDRLTPEMFEYLQKLNGIAHGRGEALAELAPAWGFQQRGNTSVLVGASRVAQFDYNMKCVHAVSFANNDI